MSSHHEVGYIYRQVAAWIVAGDVLEEHASVCIDNMLQGLMLMREFDRTLTVEQWCEALHASLREQKTMTPKEYARARKRVAKRKKSLGL